MLERLFTPRPARHSTRRGAGLQKLVPRIERWLPDVMTLNSLSSKVGQTKAELTARLGLPRNLVDNTVKRLHRAGLVKITHRKGKAVIWKKSA